ncbi:pyrroloquinoline quinone precursor peptide PqqA [Roseibium sp.]
MKTWTKPQMTAVEAGFEVTRYMPAEIGTCGRKK